MARQLVAQRQIHATINGIDGTFSQVSGGEVSANAEKIYDGGSATPILMSGSRDVGNITVVRAFDLDRDPEILEILRDSIGSALYDVNVHLTDPDMNVLSTRTYVGCLLIGMNEPEGDAASGAPASMSLVFSVSAVGSTVTQSGAAETI